jgi:rhamnulokinase
LKGVPVVAAACRDTGSAVAAAPREGEDWAYISSGTWLLMGVEIKQPIDNKSRKL